MFAKQAADLKRGDVIDLGPEGAVRVEHVVTHGGYSQIIASGGITYHKAFELLEVVS